jgi:hypothetical protein
VNYLPSSSITLSRFSLAGLAAPPSSAPPIEMPTHSYGCG